MAFVIRLKKDKYIGSTGNSGLSESKVKKIKKGNDIRLVKITESQFSKVQSGYSVNVRGGHIVLEDNRIIQESFVVKDFKKLISDKINEKQVLDFIKQDTTLIDKFLSKMKKDYKNIKEKEDINNLLVQDNNVLENTIDINSNLL